ncbi:MAG: peptidoglycan DL-endopeptidase CwlO [Actinomycetota bacterium]|jgi:cell wall-associated NlpC family hydrolase|nr:peptidoglycan DL-endopeptidase CwlO [Actinomycetota bacterium]
MGAPSRRTVPLLLAAGLTLALAGSTAVRPATALAAPSTSLRATTPKATSLDDAKAKARALRLQVDRLRTEAERATEAYDAAYDELGHVVTAHLTAQRALDNAVSTAATTSSTASHRVRALYMSGGSPALYATVLQGNDISDVLTRLQSVRRVVDGDRTARTAATKDVADRRGAEKRLAELAARRTKLEAAVSGRADKVRTLLAQTDALLAQADARVRQIAEEQRRAAEAAAATRAAAALREAERKAALSRAPTDVPAPTEAAARAIAEAMTHVGAPYVWGASGPEAFDCSGLTLTAYRAAGIELPRTAAQQFFAGPQVALGDLAPGDLLFWGYDAENPATIHHVALYVGKGLMIAAPHTGDVVKVQPVYLDGFVGAVRPSAAL